MLRATGIRVMSEFFYECSVCKGKISATTEDILPDTITTTTKDMGVRSETTFSHKECIKEMIMNVLDRQ